MKVIWKFDVETEDEFFIEMPAGAEVLSVQTQHGNPRVWVLADPKKPKAARRFSMHGTGRPADGMRARDFVGTFQMRGGAYHLFDHGYVKVKRAGDPGLRHRTEDEVAMYAEEIGNHACTNWSAYECVIPVHGEELCCQCQCHWENE